MDQAVLADGESNEPVIRFTNSSGYDQLTVAYGGDVGYDLRASESVIIEPGQVCLIPTGVALDMDDTYYARIVARSSTFLKLGLFVNEGVIDSGFRGELFAVAYNYPKIDASSIVVKAGTKIAQVLFAKAKRPKVEQTPLLSPSQRGESGFGSSGR